MSTPGRSSVGPFAAAVPAGPLPPPRLCLALPEDFRVVASRGDAALDLVPSAAADPVVRAWLAEISSAFSFTDALLCAVHVEPWRGGVSSASLVVTAQPLQDPSAMSLSGLRALALARTSTAGQVSVLDLPAGPAVGSVDVADFVSTEPDVGPVPVGVVEVLLPVQAVGVLLHLTLCTPRVDAVAAYAAVVAAIASGLQLEAGGST